MVALTQAVFAKFINYGIIVNFSPPQVCFLCGIIRTSFEGPGSSSISLFSSPLSALESLLLSLLPFSDSVSSSEKSLLSELCLKHYCISFLKAPPVHPQDNVLAAMMATEVMKIMQTTKLYFTYHDAIGVVKLGNNIHHMSIVHYRVNSNAIYKLTTELNSFI
jgi:hypothetical protein